MGMSDAATDLFAAIHANNLEGVQLLVQAEPELLRAVSPSGLSPVLFAAYYHRPAILQALIEAGAPLNLFEAAAAGQVGKVQELLEADPAQVNAVSPDGFSPLGLAAFFGHGELAAELIGRGADVHAVSRNAMQVQPLHSAVAGNHLGIVQALIAAGADVNAVQQDGFTPLMGAAQNGNAELVSFLLQHGANPAAHTADDRSAWSLAETEKHENVLKVLRDSGIKSEENQATDEASCASDWGMPDDKTTNQTGAVTGFDTPDPKDSDPDTTYTTTPAEDRVGAANAGRFQAVDVPDAKEVTGQFDSLATRNPTDMEHQLQAPEYEGAASTVALGGTALLDSVIPGEGLGADVSRVVMEEHLQQAVDQNPEYTPPSKMTPPHQSEEVRHLPSDAARVLQREQEDKDNL